MTAMSVRARPIWQIMCNESLIKPILSEIQCYSANRILCIYFFALLDNAVNSLD